MAENTRTIGILAGGGQLPMLCVHAAQEQGDDVMVITFSGQPQPIQIPDDVAVHRLALGAIGQTITTLKKAGVTHVLMAGNLEKTSLFNLKPDIRGMAFLAKHALWHDDALLTSLANLLEGEGFGVLSVADIAPHLMMPKGILGRIKPTRKHVADITAAQKMLIHMGALDIGQSVIIKNGIILGVEAIEGTEAMIERCAALRGEANDGGILVKMAKPQQTTKADLPTIGLETIEQLAKHHFSGVALSAGTSLLLDQGACVTLSDAESMFLFGI